MLMIRAFLFGERVHRGRLATRRIAVEAKRAPGTTKLEISSRSMAELDASGWTSQASDTLARACEYYGGRAAWHALRTIRLIPGQLSGLVPWLKGAGKTFPLPSVFEITPHARVARFVGYPDPERVGIFENGTVRIERVGDGAVVARSEAHRRTFDWRARMRRWEPLDALYFFGYALTHYHSLPFTLSEGRLIRVRTSGTLANRITVLDVELPSGLPTHCRRQQFYFDSLGQIVRHDYYAEIIGVWARGAHYWKRQARFSGFPISLERHVLARFGSIPLPITALHATFADAEVIFDRTLADGRN